MGVHFIGDFSKCRNNFTDDAYAKKVALDAVTMAGMTPIGQASATVSDGTFEGVTTIIVVVPLKESHLSIHTWPELGYAAVDLFTCGDCDQAEKAFNMVRDWFDPVDPNTQRLIRYASIS